MVNAPAGTSTVPGTTLAWVPARGAFMNAMVGAEHVSTGMRGADDANAPPCSRRGPQGTDGPHPRSIHFPPRQTMSRTRALPPVTRTAA